MPRSQQDRSILRSKAFLVFENLDQSTWPKTTRDSRSAYTSLKEHFVRDVGSLDDLSAADPLADDESVSRACHDRGFCLTCC